MKKWQKVFATIGLSVLLASGALIASNLHEVQATTVGNPTVVNHYNNIESFCNIITVTRISRTTPNTNATLWAHSGSGAISIGSLSSGTEIRVISNTVNGRVRIEGRVTDGRILIGYIASNRVSFEQEERC